LSASAVAFTVTVSDAKLSVIDVAADPVVTEIVLSVASPVATVNAPVNELALMLPINPLTVSAADPTSVSAVLLASAVASMVSAVGPVAVVVSDGGPIPRGHVGDTGGRRIGAQRDRARAREPQRLDARGMEEVGVRQRRRRRHPDGIAACATAMLIAAARLAAVLKLKMSLPLPPVSVSAPPPPVIVPPPLPIVMVLAAAPPVM